MTYLSWTYDAPRFQASRPRSRTSSGSLGFMGGVALAAFTSVTLAALAVTGNPWAGSAPISVISVLRLPTQVFPLKPVGPFALADDQERVAQTTALPSSGAVPVDPGWMTAAVPFDARVAVLDPSEAQTQAEADAQTQSVVADVATAAIPLPARNPLLALRGAGLDGFVDADGRDRIPLLPLPRPAIPNVQRPDRAVAALAPVAREEESAAPRLIERSPDRSPSSPDVVLPTPGSRFALYDISAGMVYLPSGETLEAHSGYGANFDNPSSVHRRMVGPTPPNTYNLTLREALFHGVEAIRLTPAGGGRMYGRDGFLVHTYMLGARGDSNGCVSVRDYARFLSAYKRGDFNRLVVVASLPPTARATPSLLSWLKPK